MIARYNPFNSVSKSVRTAFITAAVLGLRALSPVALSGPWGLAASALIGGALAGLYDYAKKRKLGILGVK